MEVWLVVLVALACLALAAVIGLLVVLAVLAAGGISAARFTLIPVHPDYLYEYLDSGATFAVVVQREFPNPPDQVFAALLDERFLRWAPFARGVTYAGTTSREVGTKRAFVDTFIVLAEQIIVNEPNQCLGVTITSSSIPLVLRSAAEVFELSPNPQGGTTLIWRVGGTPKWVSWLPLRAAAPLVRPVARWQIGKLRTIMAGG